MEPKYKVGDTVIYKQKGYLPDTIKIDHIVKTGDTYLYQQYVPTCLNVYEDECEMLLDSPDPEYQLYLKLKEKYG